MMVAMTNLPDPARQAAHMFLDILSAGDDSHREDRTFEMALQRMTELAPATMRWDTEQGHLILNTTSLMSGALYVMYVMLTALQDITGDQATVIHAIRAEIDDPSGAWFA